jgi:hypothetical protein
MQKYIAIARISKNGMFWKLSGNVRDKSQYCKGKQSISSKSSFFLQIL